MMTIRQIERHFSQQQFPRLYRELVAGRPEASAGFDVSLASAVGVAALGLIKLDELTQAHSPLYRRLLNVVLIGQLSDGGWGDVAVTALCLRALLCGDGEGPAIERGLAYLANLQKSEGIWPKEPIRRLPADSLVSAFILLQLGEQPLFRKGVRFDDAVDWFEVNAAAMDPLARQIWSHARVRCRVSAHTSRLATLWCSAA